MYNDADSLTELVDRIIAVFAQREPGPIEVILVDDASPDGSWAVIRELAATKVGVRGLSLRSNVGPILAVAAGSHHATSEVIACIDADLEIQPEVLPQVVLGIHQGADLVSGVRTQRVGLPPVRRLGTRVVRLLGALRWSDHPRDFGCGTKAWRAELARTATRGFATGRGLRWAVALYDLATDYREVEVGEQHHGTLNRHSSALSLVKGASLAWAMRHPRWRSHRAPSRPPVFSVRESC